MRVVEGSAGAPSVEGAGDGDSTASCSLALAVSTGTVSTESEALAAGGTTSGERSPSDEPVAAGGLASARAASKAPEAVPGFLVVLLVVTSSSTALETRWSAALGCVGSEGAAAASEPAVAGGD